MKRTTTDKEEAIAGCGVTRGLGRVGESMSVGGVGVAWGVECMCLVEESVRSPRDG